MKLGTADLRNKSRRYRAFPYLPAITQGEKRMYLQGLKSAARLGAAIVLAGGLSVSVWSQEAAPGQTTLPAAPPSHAVVIKDYSKGVSHFPNPIAPYQVHDVDVPNFTNTPRIDQLMQNGKLMLSMDDAVALALENNLDIAIARYNLNIADTDLLRAKAGSSILGVNEGIVQNTPGGGVGGLGGQVGSGTGGTSAGSGGAGTGAGGIVNSTLGLGSTITSYDPILTSTLQVDHSKSVCSS